MQLISRTNGKIGYVDVAHYCSTQCPIDTTMARMRVLLASVATEHDVVLQPIEQEWALDHAMNLLRVRRDPFLHPGVR